MASCDLSRGRSVGNISGTVPPRLFVIEQVQLRST